jgi:predicted 3-demethylubiquinone-9 3-methyltransferase (glyoxalase superfamily)
VKVVDFTLFGQRFQAISAGPHHEFNDAASIVVLYIAALEKAYRS